MYCIKLYNSVLMKNNKHISFVYFLPQISIFIQLLQVQSLLVYGLFPNLAAIPKRLGGYQGADK